MIDLKFVKEHKIISVILAYIIVGIVYDVSDYLYLVATGKEITFSPLISIPLVVPFWPMMLYADLKNIGIMFQDVLTIIAILIFVVIFVKSWVPKNKT
jgi:hypothetical protein